MNAKTNQMMGQNKEDKRKTFTGEINKQIA
jgi:hypothetical protein